MMSASGLLLLSKTKPLASVAADGTFALTLLAFDRIGAHQVEPWRVVWSGPAAQAFWRACAQWLVPGQPIRVEVDQLRAFSLCGPHGSAPEFLVRATLIDLAPRLHGGTHWQIEAGGAACAH